LLSGDVAVPVGLSAYGARAQLLNRRCAVLVQTPARLQRDPSDGLGQFRATGRAGCDQTQHTSARVDGREYRAHARAVQAHGLQLRLAARGRGAYARILQVGSVVLPEDVGARVDLP